MRNIFLGEAKEEFYVIDGLVTMVEKVGPWRVRLTDSV